MHSETVKSHKRVVIRLGLPSFILIRGMDIYICVCACVRAGVYRGIHSCYNHSSTPLGFVYLAFRLSLYYRINSRNQIYGFLLINVTKSSQFDVFSSNSYIKDLFNNTVGIFE